MKLLIATRADERTKKISDLTFPFIKGFAKKWNADFMILSKNADCDDELGKVHYRILDFFELLKDYDRILHVDCDIVMNKNCPNIFNIVPHDEIGTVFEDKGKRQEDRWRKITDIQTTWGEVGWRRNFINTGVFLVSKPHAEIFRRFKGELWTKSGYDDVHLGYQINRLGIKIYELSYRFNHMSMFSESWNGGASRFDSYMLHYAGTAKFPDRGKRSKVQQIRDDIRRIYGAD